MRKCKKSDSAKQCRVAKCHGYDGYIRVKILEGWGKKCRRPNSVVKWSSCGVNSTIFNEVFFDRIVSLSPLAPRSRSVIYVKIDILQLCFGPAWLFVLYAFCTQPNTKYPPKSKVSLKMWVAFSCIDLILSGCRDAAASDWVKIKCVLFAGF